MIAVLSAVRSPSPAVRAYSAFAPCPTDPWIKASFLLIVPGLWCEARKRLCGHSGWLQHAPYPPMLHRQLLLAVFLVPSRHRVIIGDSPLALWSALYPWADLELAWAQETNNRVKGVSKHALYMWLSTPGPLVRGCRCKKPGASANREVLSSQ